MESVIIKVDHGMGTICISGDPDAMCYLRNVVMDGARYHESEGRTATAEQIKRFWDKMYEAKEGEI